MAFSELREGLRPSVRGCGGPGPAARTAVVVLALALGAAGCAVAGSAPAGDRSAHPSSLATRARPSLDGRVVGAAPAPAALEAMGVIAAAPPMCRVLAAADGRRWALLGAGAQPLRVGTVVRVEGTPRAERSTPCGSLLAVVSITRL